MIVRTLASEKNTKRNVISHGFESARLLLKEDSMGYSFNVTTILKDANLTMHYKNHLETCYCISGRGSITDVNNDITYDISPGTIYILNKNDKHILKCTEEMALITIFNPPLMGREVHDEDGSYPLDAEEFLIK